jgi:hypothetical protein
MFVAPRLVGRAAGTARLGEPGGAVADRVFQGLEALGCSPQSRISAHLVSSPKVTKVMRDSRPISRAASGPVSLRRCKNEATSVSRTVGSTAGVSGQLAVTLGVGKRQEVVQFLVRLEGVRSQVIERSDRPGVLSRQQLSGRPPWPGRRSSRAVCTRCTHPNLQALAGLIATHQQRRRGLPMLSHMAAHMRCDLPSVTNISIRPHQIGDDLPAQTGRSDPGACPRSEHLRPTIGSYEETGQN